MHLSGGYVIHKRPLMAGSPTTHTATISRPISNTDLSALNAVQATPWRINAWILDVMQEAWRKGLRVGGLEVGEPLTIAGRLPDDVWAGMSKAERTPYLADRAEKHALNASIEGRSRAVLDALTVAEELRREPAIWYPHGKDFRHRIYPAATFGPQPQGSDIQKSLIHFASGLPLGEDGLYWLCVRAANTFGMDKLPLEDRVGWTLDNDHHIMDAALNPLVHTWWTEASEPWAFLATCRELDMAWQEHDPAGFVSHLPIPMDGSCNGLQHLSAMGLDPVGAEATNLRANRPRQDIYERVAERVRALVEADVVADVDEARVWHGNVDRNTVKRAVMTTPLTQ